MHRTAPQERLVPFTQVLFVARLRPMLQKSNSAATLRQAPYAQHQGGQSLPVHPILRDKRRAGQVGIAVLTTLMFGSVVLSCGSSGASEKVLGRQARHGLIVVSACRHEPSTVPPRHRCPNIDTINGLYSIHRPCVVRSGFRLTNLRRLRVLCVVPQQTNSASVWLCSRLHPAGTW